MKITKEHLQVLCDPVDKSELYFDGEKLLSESGEAYNIVDGIPVLLELTDRQKNNYALNLFSQKAAVYDKYQHLSFETFRLDEVDVRNSLVDRLNLSGQEIVLELNAGTGRDSMLINKRLSGNGKLFVQDISADMLSVLLGKFDDDSVFATQSNAERLPYRDETFDAVYSFAGVGMNAYSDTRVIMREIVRVCRPGAKVVIGGLSMAPWLYETEFGRILINHNNHYANVFDMSTLPLEARDVKYEYILNGAGFCVSFSVGEGEPEADFDYIIPGVRGGTLRTRFYGKMEGVSPETRELAYRAREKAGISMFDFLNQAISAAALDILEEKL